MRRTDETLGVVLFEQVGQGIPRTPAGEALCDHVGRASAESNRVFDLVALRLARFLSAHPDFGVRVAARMDYAHLITDAFDADNVSGSPRGENLMRMPLGPETVTPLRDPLGRPASASRPTCWRGFARR